MSELNQINDNQVINSDNINNNGFIKYSKNVPDFGDFQKKVASESLLGRAASVLGDITKGFFKEFFGVKFKEGTIPEEDISSKESGVSEGNNVSEKVTAKKVLKGIAGVVSALPFLIGMGALYIANVVRFAAKNQEDIYAYDLNKLLQSSNIEDKKQAISYLEKILANGKSTVEYNVAKNFLSKDIRPLYTCLGSTDEKLKNGTKELLTNMLKNEDPDIKAVADGIIKSCFISRDFRLKANSITLLTEMFKSTDIDMKNSAKKNINSEDFEDYIRSYDFRLKPSLVSLFTTMLKNEDTIGTAEEIIKKCLESNDLKLKANTIALLTDMLDSENTDEYEVAQTLLERNGELVDKIQGVLSEMLDNEDTKDNAIKILNNAFEGATKDKEDFFENKISPKKGFLVKNLDNLTKIEEDSSTELLLKKMFNKDETRDLTIKVLKYLDENSSYTQELREHFYNVNENSDSEVLDQEEVLGKD